MIPTREQLVVKTLGPATILSPVPLSKRLGPNFVDDSQRVAIEVEYRDTPDRAVAAPLGFEKAGPRERIFFDPENTRVGIVTCGGLCPGINNVIRAIVLELHYRYRIRSIFGIPYGFEGLDPRSGLSPIPLRPKEVSHVHRHGGSFLGLARGHSDISDLVDGIQHLGIDVLFAIGGDGTLKGAHRIHEEITRRRLRIAVVGIPKTIDNDVAFVDETFGFETAVEVARNIIDAAHTEALGARNGVAVVKLMGRDSGFLAAAAALASMEVNFCLVPEVPFELNGEHGFLNVLEQRIRKSGHAVVVVAEGCANQLIPADGERDASGNVRYASGSADVGPYLREKISAHFKAANLPLILKYIDPSYIVRSVPANAVDAIFCDSLGRNAVHAAMAGKTDVVIGRSHRVFTHVPLSLATWERRKIDPAGDVWRAVLETTGQPEFRTPSPDSLRPSRIR
jgi:6-phosphofructokinase 1